MYADFNFLSPSELLRLKLQKLYSESGYSKFSTDRFEPYDMYSKNRAFLKSDGIITFTGANGRLMALKPDVTMSIIKNTPPEAEERRLYYCENVFRSDALGECREISQTGLEYIGGGDIKAEAEVISLAINSLEEIGREFLLDIGHIGFAASYLAWLGFSQEQAEAALDALSRKSGPAIAKLTDEVGTDKAAEGLAELAALSGNFEETLERAEKIAVTDEMRDAVQEMRELYGQITESYLGKLRLDFSVGGVMDYYNGVIFKGYLNGVPSAVLSGGRYDGLMRRFGKPQPALGFAIYLGEIERATVSEAADTGDSDMLTVALPKGRLGAQVYELFASIGYECPALLENSRALVFKNEGKGVRYLWVKPTDVPVYVERGAADIGISGSDVLFEHEADIYELLDLKIGKCRMVCAACNDFVEDASLPLRVATKYPSTAMGYFESKDRRVDIIKLSGSIELAPILGLSDVIVDIVETGSTLKENNLRVVEDIMPISARLIANKSSYKFKQRKISAIVSDLEEKVL